LHQNLLDFYDFGLAKVLELPDELVVFLVLLHHFNADGDAVIFILRRRNGLGLA